MEERSIHIEPTKATLWYVLLIILASNLVVIVPICLYSNRSISNVLLYLIVPDFIILFFLLKEYKAFDLKNDRLIVSYAFLGFLFQPMTFRLADIMKLRIVKYSHQVRATPILKVYYLNCRSEVLTKKIFFSLQNKVAEFRKLIDELRSKGIEIENEGDYFYPELRV